VTRAEWLQWMRVFDAGRRVADTYEDDRRVPPGRRRDASPAQVLSAALHVMSNECMIIAGEVAAETHGDQDEPDTDSGGVS
jgi:hypothetical protein